MSKNKILFIVEGPSDEVKFLRRLLSVCHKKKEFEVYSYRTNIHVLAQELYNNYPDFENEGIDIKLILKSLKPEKKHTVLDDKYTDIFLVFDFDPHHDHPHFDTVKRMLRYFNDSTNQGKLYLNYPMMQSYKHFPRLPDHNFYSRKVSIEDIRAYKKIVGNESHFTDLTQYDYRTFYSQTVHHLKKANYILTKAYCLPTVESYLQWMSTEIYDNQLSMLTSSFELLVLNTCIFILADFAPKRFFNFVCKHKDELMI